jgi:hypothetical protein
LFAGISVQAIGAAPGDVPIPQERTGILQDANYGSPSYTTFTLPTFSPAAHGAGADTS